MSGSGGGTWTNEPSGNNCATLSQATTLNSPQKTVLGKTKKGDLLDIAVNKKGSAVMVEALYQGQVAGTITSSIIQRLAECIESGYEYIAEVIDVDGGACKVQVRLK